MSEGQKLRPIAGRGFWHHCPGCDMAHRLPETWAFDGNMERPTFTPSFSHSWGQGRRCHYVITAGQINFCPDCTHDLSGHSVPMPDIPLDSAIWVF